MAVNKVVKSDGTTLIDISSTTATAEDVMQGKTFFLGNGVESIGTATAGMNVQMYNDYDYIVGTSYIATNVTLTVDVSGTYNISWIGWRNTTSGTSGSQLYINGHAYGSATTTFQGQYGHSVNLSGVSLSAGDVLVVRARARSNSYRMYVGNLVIVQTA